MEKFLDDDSDMHDLNLTAKELHEQQEEQERQLAEQLANNVRQNGRGMKCGASACVLAAAGIGTVRVAYCTRQLAKQLVHNVGQGRGGGREESAWLRALMCSSAPAVAERRQGSVFRAVDGDAATSCFMPGNTVLAATAMPYTCMFLHAVRGYHVSNEPRLRAHHDTAW